MVYTIVVHLYAKDDATSITKLKEKLVEASQVYSKDRETLGWHVMQDVGDERKFTIVERYLKESVSGCSFTVPLGAIAPFRLLLNYGIEPEVPSRGEFGAGFLSLHHFVLTF